MLHKKFEQGASAPLPLALREEAEVMKTWEVNDAPLVSICCPTYNHVQYIEDALRGFLGQVTSFQFEIIIRDDASTDGTTEVLTKYAAKYPNIIRLVIETENTYLQGIRASPATAAFARGKYLAFCEGDDYWIVTDKLEQQIQLLRNYPQATMSVARTVVCNKNTNGQLQCESLFLGNNKDLQDFDDIKTCYFHTSTYLVHADIYRDVLDRYANKIQYSDTALRYMLAHIGPFVLLREVVSVYRITGSGVWTSMGRSNQIAWEIRLAESFYDNFDPAYRDYFGMKLLSLYKVMMFKGTWAFNDKSSYLNIKRFINLFFKFGFNYSRSILVKRLHRKK